MYSKSVVKPVSEVFVGFCKSSVGAIFGCVKAYVGAGASNQHHLTKKHTTFSG